MRKKDKVAYVRRVLPLLLCLGPSNCADLIQYFNSWAFIQTALTGANFSHSGKEAWRLFQERGWTAVVNDDLIGSALFIAGIMVAAIGAAVGGGISYMAYANPTGEKMPLSPCSEPIQYLSVKLFP